MLNIDAAGDGSVDLVPPTVPLEVTHDRLGQVDVAPPSFPISEHTHNVAKRFLESKGKSQARRNELIVGGRTEACVLSGRWPGGELRLMTHWVYHNMP
jgi:hypothetical protein